MKKFTVMIFGVSIFFIGLGAIAKQAAAKFQSNKHQALVFKRPLETKVEEKIKSAKALRVVEKLDPHSIIKGVKEGNPEQALELNLRGPGQHSKVVTFSRVESPTPLTIGEQFPRNNEEDIIIFKLPEGEKPGAVAEEPESIIENKIEILKKADAR